jgi:hypothetical protein
MHAVEGPVRLSFRDAFAARLTGEAINTLLPMGILVGEPAKAEHVGHRLPFATAFSALVTELAFYSASLVLLFGAGAVALLPLSVVLCLAAIVFSASRFVRGAIRRTAISESGHASDGRARSVIARARRTLTRLGDPVRGFAARHPDRVWRIVALEAAYQIMAVAEVYLTLALITPGHAAWRSAVVLETVSRAVTMVFKVLPMRMGVDEAGAALFANRLDLGTATGITLALIRKMRLLFWSAAGLIVLLQRSARLSPGRAASAGLERQPPVLTVARQ